MGTAYWDFPEDYHPPADWYDSADARTTLAKAYARKLCNLAVDFDMPEMLTGLGVRDLREQAGQVIINAFGRGFLRSIPNLGQYVAWHTASSDDDPEVGVDVQVCRVRCQVNLFLDVIGGHSVVAQVRNDGSVEVIGPKKDDGILPAIDSVGFERGNAAEACRFLADTILSEAKNSQPTGDQPGTDDPQETLSEADGPCHPYTWRHNGVVADDKMQRATWALVEYLWQQPSHSATFDELADPVFYDHANPPDESQVGKQRTLANKFFESNKIPLKVAVNRRDQRVWMKSSDS